MASEHYYDLSYAGHRKTCNRCGVEDLIWGTDGRSWYLMDDDCNKHECNPSSIDDFEEIE